MTLSCYDVVCSLDVCYVVNYRKSTALRCTVQFEVRGRDADFNSHCYKAIVTISLAFHIPGDLTSV